MSMRTLLVIPPKYDLTYPPLGTAALMGFLKSKGKDVSQVDWNHAYAKHYMQQVQFKPNATQAPVVQYSVWKELNNRLFQNKKASEVYYRDALRNPFDFAAYEDWTDASFHFAENLLESEMLERFLVDEKENTFLQFYKESALAEEVAKQKIDLLGISIIAPSQIIPTLTLARYLKSALKNPPKIVVGGQWCTLYANAVSAREDFTTGIDFLIRGEGESPLLSLIDALETGSSFDDVPNLLYSQQGVWVGTASHTKEDLRLMPAPDFDGLPLDQYFNFTSTKVGLTYETSRECYWNRCTYCVDLPLPHEGYRVKPVVMVVDEIEQLIAKYSCDYLIFSDPAIAPSRLKAISEEMVRRGISIPFWCFGRLEGNFNRDIFEIAKKAGCAEIDFGMETANQRLMDFVDKGTSVAEISRIIKECAESGIHVSLQVIYRFPTETYEEGLDTVNFLVEHQKWIHEISANIYYLTPGNHMFNDPEKFQIKITPGQPKFRFFHCFENLKQDTISYQDAYQLIDLYRALTSKGSDKVEVNKGWLENNPEVSGQVLESYQHEIEQVLDSHFCLNGEQVEASLCVLNDGTPVGFITAEEASALRKRQAQTTPS